MGRYYYGDVEGKFWFGVQSSDDGEYFGAVACEPNTIDYHVEDIEEVKKGIENCLDKLGSNCSKLTEFFNSVDGYNESMIQDYYKTHFNEDIEEKTIRELLVWFARLELGTKILKYMEEHDECYFTAEIQEVL